MLVMGIVSIVGSILLYVKCITTRISNKRIIKGQTGNFIKTTGVVICDAYDSHDATDINKPVTPIVEYEVNGEKYEAANSVLETGAELPVGYKVTVWYKKDNPKIAVLATDLANYYTYLFVATSLLIIGVMFLLTL